MNWYRKYAKQESGVDPFESMFNTPTRTVLRVDPPQSISTVIELYRGFNVDPSSFKNNPDGSIVISPQRSEQNVLWFSHKMVRGYDGYEYARAKGKYLLTYPLQCVRHTQTVHYSDGTDRRDVPQSIIDQTEPSENCRFYLGYELPNGWFFSYKSEKFVICDHDLTVTREMII